MKNSSKINASATTIRELTSLFDNKSSTDFWQRIFPSKIAASGKLAKVGMYVLTVAKDGGSFEQDVTTFIGEDYPERELLNFASEMPATGILCGPLIAWVIENKPNNLVAILGQKSAIEMINSGNTARLSPYEQRVILQVLAGLAMRDCAKQDEVSYATKRNQLRVAMGKLEIGRQSDVFTLFLKGFIAALMRRSSHPNSSDFLRSYCATFLPKEDVRCHVIQDSRGNPHRVLDTGPIKGQKILAVHPSVLPNISKSDIDVFRAYNLRVLWPLREGALTAEDPDFHSDVHRILALEGIKAVHATFFDGPAPMFACVDGANYATCFLEQNPEHLSKVIFGGFAGVLPGDTAIIGRVRRGAIRLSKNAPGLLRKAFDHFAETAKDLDKLNRSMEKSFKASPVDLAVIQKEFAGPDQGLDFQTRIISSLGTTRQDMMFQAEDFTSVLRKTSVPLTFVHGAHDKVQPIDRVAACVDGLPHAKLIRLPECGQLIYFEHFETMVSAIKSEISV